MGFVDAVGDAITSAVCFGLRQEDRANRFFNELSPIDVPNFPRYWLPKLCDDDPADVPTPQPPFEGGQCPVRYNVYLEDWKNRGTIGRTITQNRQGPFSDYEYEYNQTATNTYFARIREADGTQYEISGTTSGFDPDYESATVIFERVDGLPDDCGSPPPPPPLPYPPQGDTFNISPTYVDNEGDTVNLNGNFTLFAPVAIGGNVFAPVRVDLGGITFDGTLEFAPNFEFNFGQPPNTGAPGNGSDLPPNNDPTNVPDTPDDDDQRDIVGIVVTSTPGANTKTTVLPQSDGPTLYLPRIGSAYFRVRTAAGLAWAGPFDVKQRQQYISAPEGVRTLTARTHFETDWSGSVTLIYRDSKPET
jgi:hypothetical protein